MIGQPDAVVLGMVTEAHTIGAAIGTAFIGQNRAGNVVSNQVAITKDEYAVGVGPHPIEMMLCHHNGLAGLRQITQGDAQRCHCRRVELGGGFVENQNRWTESQGCCNHQALLLAARELEGRALGQMGYFHQFHGALHPLGDFGDGERQVLQGKTHFFGHTKADSRDLGAGLAGDHGGMGQHFDDATGQRVTPIHL